MLLVGVGSFFGGALRYYISTLMKTLVGTGFPCGTLLVNLSGCFLFGIIYGFFLRQGMASNSWCLLLTTGVCGGFTTFSTFVHESVQMLQSGHWGGFVAYVAISVVVGIALAALGYWLLMIVHK